MSLRHAVAVWLLALLVEIGGARLLDSLGLIEGLLSPTGARLAVLVPLAVAFYAARFVAWFIAPGLVLGALVVAARPKAGTLASASELQRGNPHERSEPT